MWCIQVFLRDFSGDLTEIFRFIYGVYEKSVSKWYQRYRPETTLFPTIYYTIKGE